MKELSMKKLCFLSGFIYAGPYAMSEFGMQNTIYIKLAPEVKLPCDIDCQIEDFSVPVNDDVFRKTIDRAIEHLSNGGDIVVGCRGGRGRTGLFLAVLYKSIGVDEPIKYVRQHYSSRAVENKEQEKYVEKFYVQTNTKYKKD